jgi:hypothetical protein
VPQADGSAKFPADIQQFRRDALIYITNPGPDHLAALAKASQYRVQQ